MRALFEAVREACERRVWSRGVELARAGAVSALRGEGGERALLVTGGPVARHVVLHPEATTWECDCPGPDDPCEHVAAAVIAWTRAEQERRALPAADAAADGRLRYALARTASGLALERQVVSGAAVTRLEVGLRALVAGRVPPPRDPAGAPVRVLASERDLAIDADLDSPLPGPLSRAALHRLLPRLAGCDDVHLDGAPITVSTEPVGASAHLVDQDGGFRLYAALDPSVTETIGDGVALCGDVLRPLRESRLTGRELAELGPGARGRVFHADQVAELVGEVLPDLAKRIPLEVHTQRLPRALRPEPPRIRVETRREGDALAVRADVVYGDPPAARVESGHLIALGGPVPIRDEAAERALARRIQAELALPVGAELRVRDEEALALAARISAVADVEIRGDAHRRLHRVEPLEPRLSASPDRVDLWFESQDGRVRAGADAVLRAFAEGRTLVSVEGGGLAPLPADWLARCGREAAALREARDARGALPRWAMPDLARLCESLGAPPPVEMAPLRALVEGFGGVAPARLPADLRAALRPYQRTGVDWLVCLRELGLGALLADDMGLGKTLQVLCSVRSASDDPAGRGAAGTLVVCPTSVLRNWADEIERFRPGLRAALYHGPARRLDATADVTLTSYAILRLDADRLGAVDWDAVVLDEAQAIKNPDSQVGRAAHTLRGAWRVALTGTPVENRLDELWSLLHFANPGLLGTRARFASRWAGPIAAGEPGAAEALRRRIRPFVLRRLKREVAPELPPRTEVVLRCELDAAERAVYDGVRAAARRDVAARLAAGASPLEVLEALLRLRQAACHSGLVPGQRAEGSSKLALLLEELETVCAEGHKALVFSQWTSLLDRVEPALRRAGIDWLRLDGATRDRGEVVARFQDEGGPQVFLLSLGAGGSGLNLTAADHVFLLDPWWNPAVEAQAADRAHRIGQTRPVMVYRLVAADTVEERVLDLQQSKRGLADAALGGAAAAGPSREDLLALLD